ncbi:hypothetical protein V6Z11_A12G244800 [Gossypium hirsutum]
MLDYQIINHHPLVADRQTYMRIYNYLVFTTSNKSKQCSLRNKIKHLLCTNKPNSTYRTSSVDKALKGLWVCKSQSLRSVILSSPSIVLFGHHPHTFKLCHFP